ncbi:MAG: hypothetical protein V1806_05295 [Pseudomonadota bacterium]
MASLVIGSSLLELYVRALIVNHAHSALPSDIVQGDNLCPEGALEEKRNVKYYELVDLLVGVGLFREDDGELAKELYSKIRIPLLHGLPRRFVGNHSDGFIMWLRGARPVAQHDLEEVIENHALVYLDQIIGILERNQF